MKPVQRRAGQGRQQVEVIRVRLVQLLDLGSAQAGLGWPAIGAQTWAAGEGRKQGAAQVPRVRIRGWPEFAGNAGSPDLFLWLTFNGHDTFPFGWIGLQSISKGLVIHI